MSNDREQYTTSAIADLHVRALLNKTGIGSTTYAIMVDKSDTTNFPHGDTGRIDVSHLKFALELASNSVGTVKLGVITRIDGTDADISYAFDVPFEKSGTRRILSINNFSPAQLKLDTANTYLITNDEETGVTAVNTGITLDSPNGNITPGLGDIIVKYGKTSGSAFDCLTEIFYGSHA